MEEEDQSTGPKVILIKREGSKTLWDGSRVLKRRRGKRNVFWKEPKKRV